MTAWRRVAVASAKHHLTMRAWPEPAGGSLERSARTRSPGGAESIVGTRHPRNHGTPTTPPGQAVRIRIIIVLAANTTDLTLLTGSGTAHRVFVSGC